MSAAAPLSFEYRLPTTWVRIAGTRTTTTDAATNVALTETKALATTEVAADPRTSLTARLGVGPNGKVEHAWKLAPDGRVLSVATTETVARLGAWPAVARTATFALSAALPLLVPGPAGWLAGLGALIGRPGGGVRAPSAGPSTQPTGGPRPPGRTADPLLDAYAAAGHDADLLVALREAVRRAAHAQAAAVASDPPPADEIAALERATRAIGRLRPELERAEAEFRAWRASAVKTTVEEFDERFRLEQLPTAHQLRAWASGTGDGGEWTRFPETWGVAVSADLADAEPGRPAPSVAEPPALFRPEAEEGVLWWRPPRPVTLTLWRLAGAGAGGTLEEVSTQHLVTPWPGNERELRLRALNSGKVAYAFADTGALVEVGTELTGTARQVAAEVEGLLTGVTDAAGAGGKLREVLAPPTLTEQLEAKEALAKLTAPPKSGADQPRESPEEAQARKALEAAQQKAQLRIAEQLAAASSPPQLVVFSAVG